MCREHLCGYDLNLSYPQTSGHFPTLLEVEPTNPLRIGFASSASAARLRGRKQLAKLALDATTALTSTAASDDGENANDNENENANEKREGRWLARRDLSGRANGTIDPWYGCFIYDEMIDYAFNFSKPWSASSFGFFGRKRWEADGLWF